MTCCGLTGGHQGMIGPHAVHCPLQPVRRTVEITLVYILLFNHLSMRTRRRVTVMMVGFLNSRSTLDQKT